MTPRSANMASQSLNDASRAMLLASALAKSFDEIDEDSEAFTEAVNHMKQAAAWLGLQLVRRAAPPAPPANLGPDDGLQHDARCDLVGSR